MKAAMRGRGGGFPAWLRTEHRDRRMGGVGRFGRRAGIGELCGGRRRLMGGQRCAQLREIQGDFDLVVFVFAELVDFDFHQIALIPLKQKNDGRGRFFR